MYVAYKIHVYGMYVYMHLVYLCRDIGMYSTCILELGIYMYTGIGHIHVYMYWAYTCMQVLVLN